MNAALVKIDVAAAALGWSAARLFDLVDAGTLIEPGFEWVFDFANGQGGLRGSHRRDLRFWFPEIEARSEQRPAPARTIDAVVTRILPRARQNFHAGEVDQLFQLRPRTRIDLHDELAGSLKSGRHQYHRDDLAAFLMRRWIGCDASKTFPPAIKRAANGAAPQMAGTGQSVGRQSNSARRGHSLRSNLSAPEATATSRANANSRGSESARTISHPSQEAA